MKATILSDLHLDHWIGENRTPKLKLLREVFSGHLDPSPNVEVLLVAGDISHNVYHLHVLEELAIIYNYKKVFAVIGNHDSYIIGPHQANLYSRKSKNKQQAWYDLRLERVTILNGTSETYRGIKFGGAMGWYDGSYNRPQGYTEFLMNRDWRRAMNDSYYMPDYPTIQDILEQEIPKVESILDSEIILTHVCPISARIAYPPEFQDEVSSMFYSFDGEDLVRRSNAKLWVYGHTHGRNAFKVHNTQLITNTLGYPSEDQSTEGPLNIEIVLRDV